MPCHGHCHRKSAERRSQAHLARHLKYLCKLRALDAGKIMCAIKQFSYKPEANKQFHWLRRVSISRAYRGEIRQKGGN